jgi:hypothetical protein
MSGQFRQNGDGRTYSFMDCFSALETRFFTRTKLSGLTDIESMPQDTRNSAKAGLSLGA